ncbi:uncharacterized protein LOC121796796 [Salvia splendens]|uniref:uncharacterized protein LOC121796796 n=1 Tax=Salvia splendens TaxID=180675 RepID=UPI001C251AB0|nr:uncharacterized protein LOC121796796 [Salvia splendens]
MVDPPGPFDTPFFVRTNTVYIREGALHFYGMGEEAIPARRVAAGQGAQVQAQRQANLERVVAELVEENRQARAELTRLTKVVESILKELARGRTADGAGTSGHGGQNGEPPVAKKKEGEPEEEGTDVPEESEENHSESEEEEPEESPAPSPTPRRSRRNM